MQHAIGKLIVLTGPSGAGKGTLLKALLAEHPELYVSISATTRSPRPGEVHGQHYFFLERAEFDQMVADGNLLEWAEFAGNCYGTPRQPVAEQIAAGKTVILEIELEGARQVRASFPEAYRIFILPPSFDELENRLRGRGTESDEVISRRMTRAKDEIAAANEFDIQIVNDQVERAVQELATIVFPVDTPVPTSV
ncbi:guanylate kinase [filamentous cyanobacterium LEGE 11480]|uniref:Guanylate kinase n=2 Tax=Romeriopsis TaxID=2992131 RepID=A0A928VIJ2_9CYAN|nr:guanylate kinase [Romeriopsis navalis LEGE 11480]